jgi:hypothetical protein
MMLLRRGQDLIDKQRSDKRRARSQSIWKLERLTRAFGSITQCADSLWYDAASALFNIASSCVCFCLEHIDLSPRSGSKRASGFRPKGIRIFLTRARLNFFVKTTQRRVAFYFHVTAEILLCRPKIACKIANERRTHAHRPPRLPREKRKFLLKPRVVRSFLFSLSLQESERRDANTQQYVGSSSLWHSSAQERHNDPLAFLNIYSLSHIHISFGNRLLETKNNWIIFDKG